MRRLWTENVYNSPRFLAMFARVPWKPFMTDDEVIESQIQLASDLSDLLVAPTLTNAYLVSNQACIKLVIQAR